MRAKMAEPKIIRRVPKMPYFKESGALFMMSLCEYVILQLWIGIEKSRYKTRLWLGRGTLHSLKGVPDLAPGSEKRLSLVSNSWGFFWTT
jgi:hypothetical protein